jgi:C1A family cysteine protease
LATDNECKIEKGTYKVKGPKKVNPDTNSHKSALLAHPFSIAIDARNWSQYTSGVFNNCGTEANHAVNAFGFDKENNWIVKNSWGTSWGEGGFIRLAPGNTCNFLGLSYIAS